ncbi:putative FGGY family of carbohydrate kinase, N-terminal domain containing protein [Leishmania naiffi]|uniref:FGGY family of carbohydrate kinase, N-terminal domain containing protein n=1 Tax=Leishmania naiffi TaxID=5678 RepID=A0AAW3B5C7_9TRYP
MGRASTVPLPPSQHLIRIRCRMSRTPNRGGGGINNTMNELKKRQDMRSVRAIGLSGHTYGATLLHRSYKVLRLCILRCDGRCYRECEGLERAVLKSRDITGNLMMPGFTAGKRLWVKKHELEIVVKGGQGATTEGLSPLPHNGRLCLRGVRFLWHHVDGHK